ncbi:MAG TPA: hypothetical protein VI076_15160 [Actinopolymorphaceae bacterium]
MSSTEFDRVPDADHAGHVQRVRLVVGRPVQHVGQAEFGEDASFLLDLHPRVQKRDRIDRMIRHLENSREVLDEVIDAAKD